jgi:DNA-binding HxlR family transcriptional regulator
MQGYGQYCPIALAAEVFAERWTPIIIRNMHLGCTHFGEILDGAPGMPRSVLSHRLSTLARQGVLERSRSGRSTAYTLTRMGNELADVCLALGVWGARWREVAPADQDPYLALWTQCRLIDPGTSSRPRIVVRFDIVRAGAPVRLWLVVDRTGNEICVQLPEGREDGVVTADTASLVRWYAGELSLSVAREQGGMTVSAPPWLERELAEWGRLSPYAGIQPARLDHDADSLPLAVR